MSKLSHGVVGHLCERDGLSKVMFGPLYWPRRLWRKERKPDQHRKAWETMPGTPCQLARQSKAAAVVSAVGGRHRDRERERSGN